MRGIREGWIRHPWEWLLLLAALAVLMTMFAAPRAQGSFHFMSIREVFPGTTGNSRDDNYFVLQAYSPGQTLLGNHTLTVYDADGISSFGCTFPNGYTAANGANQMTVLIGDTMAPLTPDRTCDQLSDPLGPSGAACWATDQITPVDCVAWGSFTGTVGSPVGTPTAVIPSGDAIHRSIAAGCPTRLEPGDDTDDSAADFALGTPTPRNNASTIVETPCGGGGGPAPAKCGGLNATKTGTAGANVLVGTAGKDVIAALSGNDIVRGLAGNDLLCGGGGRDKLIGGGGRDKLFGQAGKDTCKGGPKRDTAKTCETKRTI